MKKYENFVSALVNLEDAPNQDLNNDFVQSGLINKFNLQFELSWKLLKRLLEYEGATLAASGSPRAILKESYRFYDFIDEAAWLDMLRDRNTNVHIYDNKLAQDLIQRILNVYIPAFSQLRDGLMERYGGVIHSCGHVDHFVEVLPELGPGYCGFNLSQPHLNDMEKVFRATVDRGIRIFSLPRVVAETALAQGRPLRGLVAVV